ncbi:MAG: hypothetical protein NC302_08545 [Bacteroidales bacterium]|nr:hypothetical protein [Bacteroidales bacterium]MCM1415327.1 hypothetical protein [bacterium]MCM1424553.1 hypothetical protein [bacterium]
MKIGGIGSITAGSNMTVNRTPAAEPKDQKSKNLQNEITDVQREMQRLNSASELTVSEKTEERQKLQQEKSDLSTQLKLHQDELLKSQKREVKLAELQEERMPAREETAEDTESAESITSDPAKETTTTEQPAEDRHAMQPGTVIARTNDGTVILKEVLRRAEDDAADAEKAQTVEAKEEDAAKEEAKAAEEEDTLTDIGFSAGEMQTMVSANAAGTQAERQGALVNQTDGDIAVLKGEIRQDAYRGVDTDRKQGELDEMQKQKTRELAFEFSMIGETNAAMQAGAEMTLFDNERTFQVSGVNAQQDDPNAQFGMQAAVV